MNARLFLLDGMALAYRAHFAFITRPIMTSGGVNTSALFGFTNTLLELMQNQKPTHLAVVFDTGAPTERHAQFEQYKATRQEMPEDLDAALPHIDRMAAAFRIPVLRLDGWEADDLIGTLAVQAAAQGVDVFMVSPDKDFAQLVSEKITLYRPGRMGDPPQILNPAGVCEKWGISRPEQIIELLGLQGDSVDNIPGVPGIGEKTAQKLIAQFGDIETLLNRLGELKGKQKETLEKHREDALLSRKLATICTTAPVTLDLEAFALQPRDDEAVRNLCLEFEFSSIGRRLFGNDYRSGRPDVAKLPIPALAPPPGAAVPTLEQMELLGPDATAPFVPVPEGPAQRLDEVPHQFEEVTEASRLEELVANWVQLKRIGIAARVNGRRIDEVAISPEAGVAFYFKLTAELTPALETLLRNEHVGKV